MNISVVINYPERAKNEYLDKKSFPKMGNLNKAKEKKYKPIDILTSQYCYFNLFDLHIEKMK